MKARLNAQLGNKDQISVKSEGSAHELGRMLVKMSQSPDIAYAILLAASKMVTGETKESINQMLVQKQEHIKLA